VELLFVAILIILFELAAARWGYDSRDSFHSVNSASRTVTGFEAPRR
jgi:hypothetical protein